MLLGSIVALTAAAVPAFAGTVTQPTTNPIVVPATPAGAPYSFTVQASGFEPGAQVFIEQCDGSNPSDIFWDPTLNCDLGSSPAPAAADATGAVTFGSNDANHKFTPFKGTSPQGLFDCRALNDPASVSGNPSFTNCKVRISTNNTTSTSDQVFFAVTLPNPTVKLSCRTSGSLTFKLPLTNVVATNPKGVPKPVKAVKVGGSATVGTGAGTSCVNSGQPVGSAKYPVTSGSFKVKGTLVAGTRCPVVSNPKFNGTALTIKWQGINPKSGKLSTAGKSVVTLNSGAVAAVPTGGYVLSGPVTSGNFTGSTVRAQLALNGGVTNEANTCAAGSLGGVSFTTSTLSNISVL